MLIKLLKRLFVSLKNLKSESYYKNDMSNFFKEINDLYNKGNNFL